MGMLNIFNQIIVFRNAYWTNSENEKKMQTQIKYVRWVMHRAAVFGKFWHQMALENHDHTENP
jgi:hypothetical protein